MCGMFGSIHLTQVFLRKSNDVKEITMTIFRHKSPRKVETLLYYMFNQCSINKMLRTNCHIKRYSIPFGVI